MPLIFQWAREPARTSQSLIFMRPGWEFQVKGVHGVWDLGFGVQGLSL